MQANDRCKNLHNLRDIFVIILDKHMTKFLFKKTYTYI